MISNLQHVIDNLLYIQSYESLEGNRYTTKGRQISPEMFVFNFKVGLLFMVRICWLWEFFSIEVCILEASQQQVCAINTLGKLHRILGKVGFTGVDFIQAQNIE